MTDHAELIRRLEGCANDPMWADHAEISKRLLREAISALQAASGGEPVAWTSAEDIAALKAEQRCYGVPILMVSIDKSEHRTMPLYARPPQPPQARMEKANVHDGQDTSGGMDAKVVRGTVGLQLDLDEAVNRFLSWPLPDSVRADEVATIQGRPHRIGTNLLSAIEARAMLTHVLRATPSCPHDRLMLAAGFTPQPPQATPPAEDKVLLLALTEARCFIGGITHWRRGSCGTVDNVYVGQVSREQTDALVATIDTALAAAKGEGK